MLSAHTRAMFTRLAWISVVGLASTEMIGCDGSPPDASASGYAADDGHSGGSAAAAQNTGQKIQPVFYWPADPESGTLRQIGKYPKDIKENPSLYQINGFPDNEVPAYNIDPIHVRMVQASEVERMIDSGGWMLVDVRKDRDLAEKGTIPGALHYEYKHVGAVPKGSTKLTSEAIEDIFEIAPKGVIIFCNGSKCPRSFNACVALAQEWGIPGEQVVWFRDGAPAWDRSPLLLVKPDAGTHTHTH